MKKIVSAVIFLTIAVIFGVAVSFYGIDDRLTRAGETDRMALEKTALTEFETVIQKDDISSVDEILRDTQDDVLPYSLCGIEGCTQTEAHNHGICSVAGCTESTVHMHDGVYCYPHSADDGHAYHNCGREGCMTIEAHSHNFCGVEGCTQTGEHYHQENRRNHHNEGHRGHH